MQFRYLTLIGILCAFASAETNATTTNTIDAANTNNAPQIVGQPMPPMPQGQQMQPIMAPVGAVPMQGHAMYGGIPQDSMNKIQQMYPGSFVTDIDWEPYGIEVELNGYLKVFMDHGGNILGAAYDD